MTTARNRAYIGARENGYGWALPDATIFIHDPYKIKSGILRDKRSTHRTIIPQILPLRIQGARIGNGRGRARAALVARNTQITRFIVYGNKKRRGYRLTPRTRIGDGYGVGITTRRQQVVADVRKQEFIVGIRRATPLVIKTAIIGYNHVHIFAFTQLQP